MNWAEKGGSLQYLLKVSALIQYDMVYSPCYIDNTADVPITTRRILWGKLINAGQTCIAPDYILCSKEVQSKFLEEAKKVLDEWYGQNHRESPDLCRIVNQTNFQ